MNKESFYLYTTNFGALLDVSYEEVKSAVDTYPYSANLHYLLLIKSKFSKHVDYEANLAMAAAYSKNRAVLYDLVQALEYEKYEEVEEVLELIDLESLELTLTAQKELVEAAPVEMPHFAGAAQSDTDNIIQLRPNNKKISTYQNIEQEEVYSHAAEEETAYHNIAASAKEDQEPTIEKRKTTPILYPSLEEAREEAARIDEIAANMENPKNQELIMPTATIEAGNKKPKRKITKKKVMPQPKTKFESWATARETLFKDETKKVEEIVTGSVTKKNGTASETLATILEKQGHYSQAIEMYKQLSLHFPEKSSFFAAKIDNLKKL